MQFQRAQENSQGVEARGRVCGMVRQEMAAETHDVGLRPGALDLGGAEAVSQTCQICYCSCGFLTEASQIIPQIGHFRKCVWKCEQDLCGQGLTSLTLNCC